MLRISLVVLFVLSLAACSSAPPRSARSSGGSYGANALRTTPPGSPRFVDHSIGREEISIEAMSLIGVPYRWGGNTPDSGFDCSGLVRYVVGRAARVDLPRTTADISRRGESVEPDEIAPGDLIFFNTTGRPHSHVGIYVGKLRFVNAPSTGGTVRLDYLTNPYWARRFDGIRRVAPPLQRPSPFDAPTELAAPRGPAAPETTVEPPARTALASGNASAPRVSTGRAAEAASSPGTQGKDRFDEDPLDATADAFQASEPAVTQAAQRARQSWASREQLMSTESNAQATGASTAPNVQSAPGSNSDDPIARFATNGD